MAQGSHDLTEMREERQQVRTARTSFIPFSTVMQLTDCEAFRVDGKTSQNARARTKASERALKTTTASAKGYS